MSQTKELDLNEKMVTTLAIIAGLILFGLMLTKCQKGADLIGLNIDGEATPAIAEDYTAELTDNISNLETQMVANLDASDKKLAELQAKYDVSQDEVIDLLAENAKLKKGKLSGSGVAATSAVAAGAISQTDFDALKSKFSAQEKELNVLKADLAKDSGVDLEAQNKELREKLDTLTLEKNSITEDAANTKKELNEKIKALSAGAKGRDADAILKAEIAKADGQWKKQLDKQKVDHELEKAKLQSDYKAKLAEYRNIVRSSKAKKVFATSSDDLAPAAQSLIKSLSGYAGKEEAVLNKLYTNLDENQNAKRKLIVNFASGSSAVGEEYQTKIGELLKKASPNSYFVAVGYADMTGTAAKNKALSSKRATRVAEVIKPKLQKSQITQAYYLGQTDRFGAEENNRVVEVWEITE